MEAWIGLAGVVAGALIAFGGQHLNRRSDIRERTTGLLLEQFSLLVALSEDYRNRIWEERNGLSPDVVSGWDLQAYRMAEARVRILCRDESVAAAVRDLKDTGVELGKAWRLTRPVMRHESRPPGIPTRNPSVVS